MGRPRLPLGTYGEISAAPAPPTAKGKPRYKARARFRGSNGVTTMVARYGQTKAEAKRRVKEALTKQQQTFRASAVGRDSTVAELARAWLDQPNDWASNTRERYELAVRKQIIPHLGGVRVAELRRSGINTALTAIVAESGPGAAKSAKSALAGMCRHALALEALDVNPVRDTVSITGPRKAKPRALTVTETEDLCDLFRSDLRAGDFDLPDLVEWMLGTGARIGEACAARDDTLDLDLKQWDIDATVIRVKGDGLRIQPRPKSKAGSRILPLPTQCVDIARRRGGEVRFSNGIGVLFGSPFAKSLRDPSNTAGDLREVLDRIGCPDCHGRGWHPHLKTELQNLDRPAPKTDERDGQRWNELCAGEPPMAWVSSHTFRKTVATRLDEAGWSSGQIADFLGHSNPSMTQDVYVGRRVVSPDAARILER